MRTALAMLALLAAIVAGSARATPGLATTMAALGGPNSAGPGSWSAGTDPDVDSHSRRLTALGRRCCRWHHAVEARNFARAGFTVAQLAEQARRAEAAQARYVTVDLGAGDLCGGTPLAAFRMQFAAGVRAFRGGRLGGRMLVLSVENPVAHWRVVRADPAGARWLRTHRLCGLGFDASAAQLAPVARRAAALNAILDRVCFRLGCLYDAGAHNRMPLSVRDFASGDYARLSIAGERKLAATEWRPALALLEAIS
jgi:hypothetical protein